MITVRLGDVCQTFTGGTPSRTKPQYFGGGIPWVKITDMLQGTVLATDESLSDDGIANSSAKVLPVGTVLISIFATIGRTAVLGIEAATNQAIAGVIPKDTQQLQSDYLRYFLDSKHSELNRVARGVAQPNINQGILKGLEIPIPPLSEQRRIVDILSRAEGIVRLRREAEKKAAELIPGIFLEMFGDPATNQRGWPRDQLGGLLSNIDSGISPRCHDRKKTNGEWGVLRLSALTGGEYNEAEHKTLPEEIEATPSIEVKAGDVLVSRKNTYELVGTCSYVWETVGHMLLPDLIFRLKIRDAQKLHPIYLWVLLGLPAKRSQIKQLASGSAGSMPNISKQRLMTLPVELPPIGHQVCFSEAVAQIRGIRIQQAAATAKAQATFDALLAQAFSASLI